MHVTSLVRGDGVMPHRAAQYTERGLRSTWSLPASADSATGRRATRIADCELLPDQLDDLTTPYL